MIKSSIHLENPLVTNNTFPIFSNRVRNKNDGSRLITQEMKESIRLLEPIKNESWNKNDHFKALKKVVLKTNPNFINNRSDIWTNRLDDHTSITVLSTELNPNYLSKKRFLKDGKVWELKNLSMKLGVNPDTREIEILNYDNANMFTKDGYIRRDLFHQVETAGNDNINDTIEVQTDGLVNRRPKEASNPMKEGSMFFELDDNLVFLARKIEQQLRGYLKEVMKSSFAKEHLSEDDALLFYYDMLSIEPERLLHTKEPLTTLQARVIKSLAIMRKSILLLKSKVKDDAGKKIYNPLKKMKIIKNIVDIATTEVYDQKTLIQLEIDNSGDTEVDKNETLSESDWLD